MKDLQGNKGIFGTDSLSASQEQLLQEILETVITELSSLALQLGKVSEVLETQSTTVMKLRELLQLNYRKEVDGVSGLRAVENSDSGSEDSPKLH